MKKLLLFILCNLIISQSFAQKIRFTDSTNVWKVLAWVAPPNHNFFSHYTCLGKITYQAHQYNEIFDNYLHYSTYVREDTINNKVYVNFHGRTSIADTNERLLYNYNVKTGDTITDNFYDNNFVGIYLNTVKRIDSVLINTVWHKIFYIEQLKPGSGCSYEVIEGIGCIEDPFYPATLHGISSAYTVCCFNNRYGSPAITPAVQRFDNVKSCSDSILNVNYLHSQITDAVVYPLPAAETVTIQLPHAIEKGALELRNMVGQLIAEITVTNQSVIQLTKQQGMSGMYVYTLKESSGIIIYSGRLVFY